MAAPARPPVLPDIVEEHFDELDVLWEVREANLATADWTLADLADHEARAEAHRDGLRLAEATGVDLARARVAEGGSASTAAALVLLDTGDAELATLVLDVLGAADDAGLADGVRVALRHGGGALLARLAHFVATAPAIVAAAAADVLAFRRVAGPSFDRLLLDAEPWVRRIALGALGRTGALAAAQFERAADDAEPVVRRAAFRAAARAGLPGLGPVVRALAARETDPDPEAVAFLGVLGDPADLPRLAPALRRPDLAPAAVAALGASGRVQAVPVLLELMRDDALGAHAVAAYRRITGAGRGIEGSRPFPPSPVAAGEDEDETLPPDPEAARADWARRQGAFAPDVAWQGGHPIPDGAIPAAFDQLTLEARDACLLRVRSRVGGEAPDLELEALAHAQGRG